MKASEFEVGTHVLLQYQGNTRWEILHKGTGHGNVHKVRAVDVETGLPKDNPQEHWVSSRQITEQWGSFIARNPTHIADMRAREIERVARNSLMESIEEICNETATLLCALGFEAKVVRSGYGKPSPFLIEIVNPTENQAYLRKLVAEKWEL